MSDKQAIETADHRIFGFNELGQLRANLYNGAGVPDAGALYSWVCAGTSRQLANKLGEQWEQPLTEGEWDVIEQLEAPTEAEAEMIDCEDCGGTGRDPGSLNPFEPEDCRHAVARAGKLPCSPAVPLAGRRLAQHGRRLHNAPNQQAQVRDLRAS
jgi:hypothetical protein